MDHGRWTQHRIYRYVEFRSRRSGTPRYAPYGYAPLLCCARVLGGRARRVSHINGTARPNKQASTQVPKPAQTSTPIQCSQRGRKGWAERERNMPRTANAHRGMLLMLPNMREPLDCLLACLTNKPFWLTGNRLFTPFAVPRLVLCHSSCASCSTCVGAIAARAHRTRNISSPLR